MGSIENVSPALKEDACTPASGFTVNMTSLIGPRISSTLPTLVFLSTYIDALKYGTFACVSLQTRSPSQSCISVPTGSTESGGPSGPLPPLPLPKPRPPLPPPRPRPPKPRPLEAGGRIIYGWSLRADLGPAALV